MIQTYLAQIYEPPADSHKGVNGRTLIIGGSDLFHAASQWSFQVISRIVDMTFYSSVAENNEIIQEAKIGIQDGVVVRRLDLSNYLQEADSVLLGPGMRRDFRSRFKLEKMSSLRWEDLNELDWEFDTQAVTAVVLKHFPDKHWVIDAGALQVVRPSWLPPNSVLTPHQRELADLTKRLSPSLANFADQLKEVQSELGVRAFGKEQSLEPVLVERKDLNKFLPSDLADLMLAVSVKLNNANLIIKGQADLIWNNQQIVAVVGGNAGMAKGGTGDVLAGLVAGLAAKSEPFASAVVGSYLCKLAGHQLYTQSRAMYNTSDLVNQLPLSWANLKSSVNKT